MIDNGFPFALSLREMTVIAMAGLSAGTEAVLREKLNDDLRHDINEYLIYDV